MSYCRFSSGDFQCDVYVYDSQDGVVTWVAGYRRIYRDPLPAPIDFMEDPIAWTERFNAVMNMDFVPESLPEKWAQKNFVDQSYEDCANRLKEMKKDGLWIPDEAIEALLEDHKEYIERSI